ncbi:hypothetical protein HG537_0G00480 [Torulaspora globosa]|uniref:RNase III domain-containing protein n=1 Tax=Torulaspora globosa TaxID=48254 RepID=A0A7H9HVP0_9SACH|nr:hypothetical protein HG537_0G00480 [Torulaspora sp. CBS 2947]
MTSMASDKDVQRAALLRRYCKLQNALAEVCEALKVIEGNALSSEEIRELHSNENELEQVIARSSVVSLSTYLKEADSTAGTLQFYESKKFKEDAKWFNGLVNYPVVSDPTLENLAFRHKSTTSIHAHATKIDMAVATNERLEFLGDSWLGALVSYILYKRYPYANEGALSKMRSAIVNNANLSKWCKKVGFDQRLQANIPKMVHQVKDWTSKYHADCFEAYVGALVVDRYAAEFGGIVDWLEQLSSDIFDQMGSQMVADPMNKNAKHELSQLLLQNKAGAQLAYHRLNSSSPFKVEVKLGDISLATGEGSSIKEAEQRAAMKALLDTTKIKTYSLYEIEDRLIESSGKSAEPIALLGNIDEQALQRELEVTSSEENLPKASKSIPVKAKKTAAPEVSQPEPAPEVSQPEPAPEVAQPEPAPEVAQPEPAPEGISQAQMDAIVAQITGQLKQTVLSTVTAAIQGSGLQLQPTGDKVDKSAAKVDKAREVSNQNQIVQDIPAPATELQTKPANVAQLNPLDQAPFVTRAKIDSIARNFPQTLSKPQAMPQPQVIPKPQVMPQVIPKPQPAPMSASPSVSKPSIVTSPDALSAISKQPYPSPTVQGPTSHQIPQQAPGIESFPQVDSSWKQRLYAFLGPRGCKPYYKTEAIGLQTFSSSCMIEGFTIVLGTGTASSKKQAEQIAAYQAFHGEELKEFLANPLSFSIANN